MDPSEVHEGGIPLMSDHAISRSTSNWSSLAVSATHGGSMGFSFDFFWDLARFGLKTRYSLIPC